MPNLDLFWALSTISAGVAAFLGSYLKKKGENFATHEDIRQLVIQVEATTAATKAIEGRISDEFWNKQRVWDMKKESLVRLLTNISELSEELIIINRWGMVFRTEPHQSGVALTKQGEAVTRYDEAAAALLGFRMEVTLLCSKEVTFAANEVLTRITDSIDDARTGELDLARFIQDIGQQLKRLHIAFRHELGIPPHD